MGNLKLNIRVRMVSFSVIGVLFGIFPPTLMATKSTETSLVIGHKPTVENVTAYGSPNLKASYNNYNDRDGDVIDKVTYQWYRADNASGGGMMPINGATDILYIVPHADFKDKFFAVEITPIAISGDPIMGDSVMSSFVQSKYLHVENVTYSRAQAMAHCAKFGLIIPSLQDVLMDGLDNRGSNASFGWPGGSFSSVFFTSTNGAGTPTFAHGSSGGIYNNGPIGVTCMRGQYTDYDGDGLLYDEEFAIGTDPAKPDTDGDGFSDGNEVAAGSNPLDKNSPYIPPTIVRRTWLDANSYCSSLGSRLPTQAELENTFLSLTTASAIGSSTSEMCDKHGWPLDSGQCGGGTLNYWIGNNNYTTSMVNGVTSGPHPSTATAQVVCFR